MDTYGWLLVLSGQVDQGIDMLRNANDIRQVPDIHYHLGEAYIRKQFGDQAQQELDTAMNMVKRALKDKPHPDPSLVDLQGKIEQSMAGCNDRRQKAHGDRANRSNRTVGC